MAEATESQEQAEVQQTNVDPWEMAFAALEQEDKEGSSQDVSSGEGGSSTASEGTDASSDSNNPNTENQGEPNVDLGGFGDLDRGNNGSDEASASDDSGITIDSTTLEEIRNAAIEDVTERAIQSVAQAYIKKGARHTNGRLGATIDDKDICKRDEDGVPHFYNPDTGREFGGDNPRRQAQEWCDDYNRQLAAAFNQTCEGYSKKLLAEVEPAFKTLEFTETYDKLDPVRQIMLDQLLEGHEVYDQDGDLVGFDCDLNTMLSKVNNQVRFIQQHYQQSHQTQTQADPSKPSGPALDMKNTPGDSSSGKPQFKSIAEALEYQQDQALANLRAKKN